MILQKFTKDGLTFNVDKVGKDGYTITVEKKDEDIFSGLYPTFDDLKRNFDLVQELFLGKAKVKLEMKNEAVD